MTKNYESIIEKCTVKVTLSFLLYFKVHFLKLYLSVLNTHGSELYLSDLLFH